jgi:hypothetical protein
MKRIIAGIVALGVLAIPAAIPTAQAKLAKPTKIDGKLLTVTGGNPWPLGLEGEFGKLRVTFDSPATTQLLSKLTLTCTPTVAGFDPISKEFALTIAGGKYASATPGFANNAGKISLDTDEYPGKKYPPMKCKVDATNATATAAGKVPKLPTSPTADCAGKPGDTINGIPALPPVAPDTATNTQFLSVNIDAGAVGIFPFCTTDATYDAKINSDQATRFTMKTKVKKGKKGAADVITVSKLLLTAPVNSSVPLNVQGSKIVYKYDKANLTANSCVPSAAKTAGKVNTCTINAAAGTLTINSNDVSVVKVGKPIVGATLTIVFTYKGPQGGSASMTFDNAETSIGIGPNVVKVALSSRAAPAVDPNRDLPIATFTGLNPLGWTP